MWPCAWRWHCVGPAHTFSLAEKQCWCSLELRNTGSCSLLPAEHWGGISGDEVEEAQETSWHGAIQPCLCWSLRCL